MSTGFQDPQVPPETIRIDNRPQILDTDALSAVVSYIPSILLETICLNPDRPVPWMDPLEGSLLLADISGFTNMSERLAEAGKEGAEWLTSIINQYFHTMLDIAHRHGGTNLKFGGDALLVMFRGDNHAQQAVTAAHAMQRATHKFTTFRVGNYRIRLNMTVGVHSGLFWSAVAGLPGRRMQHFILGPDASFAAKTQAKATAGELIISKTTYNLTSGLCLTEPHGEAYRVVGITRRAPGTHSTEERDILPTSVTRTLLAYLPPPIAEALRSGDQTRGIEGEHRKVIILFINLLGTDELLERSGPAALLNELQQYTSCLVNLADKYSGFVAGNDIYTDGLKLITIFGAPVAHEQDSANALRLALELKREMGEQNLTLRHRIGINSGFVFTGDVGPSYCRQYTVMGDAVNLSARLMSSSSPGQVLISKQVTIESGPSFIAREMPPIQVKGKSHPIPVCALEAEDTLITDKFVERSGELFGRKNEIDTFLRLCGEVESGRGWTIAITGEPGTGKSRLSLEFQHLLGSRKWVIHRSACYSHTAGKPFAPWIHILNSFFNIASEDSVEARTEKVLAATGHLCSASLETAPLLNPLLGLSIPQNDVVRSLDDENRRRRLFELIAELLQAAAADIPFAIILEDLHWADYSSLQIVNYIATTLRSSRILMCLTHRPKKEIALDLSPSSTVAFQLGDLPKHAALQIIQTVVGRTELPDGIVETILSKSQGNPLFLEEIARSMWQSGTLDRLLSLSSSSLAVELASLEIPDRIQSLLMSRVDTLNPATKEVLRAAAVVGNTFDFPTLQSLLDLRPGGIPLESRLQELARFDLISRSDDVQETVYHFKQTLIQEVAYSSLLFARRRQLHHRVASSLEETNKGKLETIYEVLVHHYNLSRDNLKTRTYSLKAADKAREVFAHDEAIEFYRLGLNSLHGKDIALVAERSYFLERIGDCYEASGHHVEAARNYSQALHKWTRALRYSTVAPVAPVDFDDNQEPKIRRPALKHKIAVAYERNSDYGLALKHLDTALQEIPPRQPQQTAKVIVTKSLALFRKGLYEQAIRWGRLGLTLSKRSRDQHNLAYAYNILASSYLDTGNIKKAIRYRQAAIRLYEELGNLAGQAEANNNLGASYQSLGNQDLALHHFEIALALCERLGNFTNVAIAHNNVGEVLITLGRTDKAISHLLKVVETYEKKGDPLACSGLALVNLSRAYQRKNEYESALNCLKRGKNLLRKAGARGLLVEALLQESELQLATSQIEPALTTCQKALRFAQDSGIRLLEARGLHILGRIDTARKLYAQAETGLQQSAALAKRINADYERGIALLSLAKLYMKLTDDKDSCKRCYFVLKQAAAVFQRVGAKEDLGQVLQMQSKLTA